MKKFFSISLVFCMLFVLTTTGLAVDNDRIEFVKGYEDFIKGNNDNCNKKNVLNNNSKINEYDYLTHLQSKSPEELKKLNFNEEEIKEIKTIDYKLELEKRKNYEINELKAMGYSDNDIKILKSFEGTEEEMRKLGGSIWGNEVVRKFNYDSKEDITEFVIDFYWHWDKAPIVQYKDIIGCSWTEDYLINTRKTDVLLQYVCRSNGEKKYDYLDVNIDKPCVVSCIFPIEKGTNVATQLLRGGGLHLHLYKQGKVENIAALFKYGHTIVTISGSPSIKLKGGTSFGFSPSKSVKEEISIYHPDTLD